MKKEQIAKYVLARRRNKLRNASCHGVVTNCETRFDTVPEHTTLENREERIMPKGSPELTAARKEEIINACEQLYQTMSFKDVGLADAFRGYHGRTEPDREGRQGEIHRYLQLFCLADRQGKRDRAARRLCKIRIHPGTL